jgi:HTH-type transcriptional regulator, sugar sensing transcriptional regulator
MEEKVLGRLGLSKLEVKVYLALLQLREPTVIEISRKSKVERTRTYGLLESLIEKGLVSFVIENKVKKFKACDPEKILHQLKEKEAAFIEVLPKLKKMSQFKEKDEPSVEVFRGTRGVKAMINEILEVKKDYCIICEDTRDPKLNFFLTHFEKSIEKENLCERVLLKKRADIIKSKNTLIRFLPEKYSYHTTTIIYGDMVGIIIYSEPFLATRTKSKELADTYRSYFEIIWEISKKE